MKNRCFCAVNLLCFCMFFIGCDDAPSSSSSTLCDGSGEQNVTAPINQIHMCFEANLDMRGYYADNNCRSVLSNIESALIGLRTNMPLLNYRLIGDDIMPTTFDTIGKIGRKFAQEGRSSFDALFANATKRLATNENDVVILFTDALLIREGQKEIEADLQRRLTENLRSLDKFKAVSVYAFFSDFTGLYFNSIGRYDDYKNEKRPYYFFVVGKSEHLLLLEREVFRTKNILPEEIVHFGIQHPNPAYEFFRAESEGDWDFSSKARCSIDGVKKGDVFWIGFNFEGFENELDRLSLGDGLKGSLSIKNRNEFETTSKIQAKEKKNIEKYTHFVGIEVQDVNKKEDILNLFISSQSPTWVQQFHTNEDVDRQTNRGRTRSFNAVINSFTEAISRNRRIVDITIPIN